MPDVQIRGAGVTALAVARALAYHAIPTGLVLDPPRTGPDLLLTRPTLGLLNDLFGCAAALFANGTAIRGRLVCWGGGAEPELVEEPGLAIPAAPLHQVLREALLSRAGNDLVHVAQSSQGIGGGADWEIETRRDGANDPGDMIAIGARAAICCRARLAGHADPTLAAVEAVGRGWLFLLPLGERDAVVQAIVPRLPDDANEGLGVLLAQSRLIAGLVAALDGEARIFPCAPRFRMQPAQPQWLAAGDAALSFDPLCGDGTGQALSCGLLAAAVVAAIGRGEPAEDCLTHYRVRLRRAMLAHLKATIAFYRIAKSGDVWQDEIASTNEMLDRLAPAERTRARAPTYRLDHFSLVRAVPL
jgi:2-polyprenyl-6-methoxyphenol hydroxylase-like FAD-dependent oxidoreductase